MPKANSINLADYSADEIARIMAMKTKDRNELETRIYKKKKYEDWIARGKGPKKKKDKPAPAPTKETLDDMIERNSSSPDPEESSEESSKKEESTEQVSSRRYRRKTEHTVPSKWMDVPSEDKMKKDEMLGKQCLVAHEGHNLLCRITGTKDDVFCFCTGNPSLRFELNWEQVYIALKYATILRLPQKIEKEEGE